jgi:hypothetical protein
MQAACEDRLYDETPFEFDRTMAGICPGGGAGLLGAPAQWVREPWTRRREACGIAKAGLLPVRAVRGIFSYLLENLA